MGQAKTRFAAFDAGTAATPEQDLAKPAPAHVAMSVYWDKVTAILGGIDAMRAAGEKYLPKFPKEKTDPYNFRLKSTKMTNVFRDIVEDLSQRPFADEVKLGEDVPDEIDKFCLDVDGSGSDITQFCADYFYNGIANTIDWAMIDFPNVVPNPNGQPRTREQDKQEGIRPLWTHIRAFNMLEVRSSVIDGKEVIVYARIFEPKNDSHLDRVRICQRSGNLATWELWERAADVNGATNPVSKWVLIDSGTFSINIIPLVPFVTGHRQGNSWIMTPAMQDAADLQIQLYQDESNLNHAKIKTAFPMIAANGVKPPMKGVGADATPADVDTSPGAVLFAPPDGKGVAGSYQLLEPSATSLTFLANDIASTIQNLRELGRQPLTAQSGNLTVITAGVAAQKGNSAVKAWAILMGRALESCLTLTCLWLGVTWDEPKATLFTDFEVDGQEKDQDTLNTMRTNHDISQKTYWHEMKRRGVLSPDFDDEAETKAILDETPADMFTPEITNNPVPPDPTGKGKIPPTKKLPVNNPPAK